MPMYIAMLLIGMIYLVLLIIVRTRPENSSHEDSPTQAHSKDKKGRSLNTVPQASWQATVIKAFTSFFFLMTMGAAALADGRHYEFAVFIGGGLLLGLLGDIWLELKYLYPLDSENWTMMGFLVFLVGHFFYLAAVNSIAGIRPAALAAGIAGVAVAAAFILMGEKPMHLQYGRFKTISVIYGSVLFFMAVYTLTCAFLLRNLGLLVMGIGGALFLLSDLVLSCIYFGEGNERPGFLAVNYILYYVGQYLIASSVLWIGKLF
ncbi:MAG: lysoplasmalogenase [Clostridiales bacterium]|nr:lysoplasmalogenase [Clostridiales bacterium]